MSQAIEAAQNLCKTMNRNGFEGYVINIRLHKALAPEGEPQEIDVATDMTIDDLIRVFPSINPGDSSEVTGVLEDQGLTFRFYSADVTDGSHPENTVARTTRRMLQLAMDKGLGQPGVDVPGLCCPYTPKHASVTEGFADLSEGVIRFTGMPDETLKRNYMLGFRALRFAANFSLHLEANTWMAVVRGAQRMLDYCPVTDIMDEWRKVEAENMCHFVRMLFDSQLLHGLIPEVAALSRVMQVKNETGATENVLEHTLETMRRYPEELPYDWFGVLACLFHDVGKLFTGEFLDGQWSFYHHPHVGAKVTRKILGRMSFPVEDVDLVCHLVRHHHRFHFMLNDRGIRRFKALDEYPRLIEMARASIKASEGSYAEFNHNMKILERADMPESTLEPLLNGNEIMQFTGLKPGPAIGVIREALLQAQIDGSVNTVPDAVEFAIRYKDRERL